jgi:bifunctional ADP-heptose synthase (sugar kinase/adenylyltransferase)
MLLALRTVDFVHIVDVLQPVAFLEALKPHVHVTGSAASDSSAETDAVTRGGGRIHVVHDVHAYSTSERSRPLQPRV